MSRGRGVRCRRLPRATSPVSRSAAALADRYRRERGRPRRPPAWLSPGYRGCPGTRPAWPTWAARPARPARPIRAPGLPGLSGHPAYPGTRATRPTWPARPAWPAWPARAARPTRPTRAPGLPGPTGLPRRMPDARTDTLDGRTDTAGSTVCRARAAAVPDAAVGQRQRDVRTARALMRPVGNRSRHTPTDSSISSSCSASSAAREAATRAAPRPRRSQSPATATSSSPSASQPASVQTCEPRS